MLGYNSKGSTSIRETARMMSGIVDAVERDSDFWYRGKWAWFSKVYDDFSRF